MARGPRKGSNSGIYHVMLRGVNMQRLFEEAQDCEYFLRKLSTAKEKTGVAILAYCLMGNHVHILLRGSEQALSQFFKIVGVSYAYYFNKKYNRAGHLFQDRFKSEPIENDGYFLSVVNYIWQNPVKAKICDRADEYQWSSLYVLGRDSLVVDELELLKFASEDEFRVLVKKAITIDPFFEKKRGRPPRTSDEGAQEIMASVCGARNSSQFQTLSRNRQKIVVGKLRAKDVSIRQIARITGLGKKLIEMWTRG